MFKEIVKIVLKPTKLRLVRQQIMYDNKDLKVRILQFFCTRYSASAFIKK